MLICYWMIRNLLSAMGILMKTLKVAIPVTEDETVSGVVAVPENFQKDSTAGTHRGTCHHKEINICLNLSETNMQPKSETKPGNQHKRNISSPPAEGFM